MAKPERMPEIVFIGPTKKRAKFKHVVFLVKSREGGVPRELVLLRDDESVDLEQGMEFMTGYVPEFMTRPK